MKIVDGAIGVVTKAADATTAAAGAVGGAAINGVAGGVQGAASGVRNGLQNGSHSSAAAALTFAAVGAAGLVEWPILLAIGGTALVVHRLSGQSSESAAPADTGRAQTPRTTTARTKATAPRAKAKKTTTAGNRTPNRSRRTSST